jgi:putative ABC transport system substrate-binding protein
MIARRAVIAGTAALGLGAPLAAHAQQPKCFRIGGLGVLTPEGSVPTWYALKEALHELGYVEGRNVVFEERWARGVPDRLPGLAAELVQVPVDVIVVGTNQAIAAAKQATSTTPIVMVLAIDPVRHVFVQSLARPGGNITGLTNDPGQEVHGKMLQLFKEIVPKLTVVGVVVQQGIGYDRAALEAAARQLGLRLDLGDEIRTSDDIADAFAALKRKGVHGYYMIGGPVLFTRRQQVAELALAHRLPGMHFPRDWVEAGCLVSYGASLPDLYRRAAVYVDKILKGGEACRSCGRAARAPPHGDQPEDREDARNHDPAIAADACRRGDSMRRRALLLVGAAASLGSALVAPPTSGQPTKELPRVGVLGIGVSATGGTTSQELRDGLRKHGFVDGRDIVVEVRWTGGRTEALARLAAELAALKPAVIVTFGPQATQAALTADRVASVVALLGGAVESAFAAQLARLGGRVTGVSFLSRPLNEKRLELLAELLPKGSAVLHLAETHLDSSVMVSLEAAARSLGLVSHVAYASTPEEIETALATARRLRVSGINVLASPFLHANRVRIIDLAAKAQLPTIYQWPQSARNGGLMAYGPSLEAIHQQLVVFVVRILNGAKPADLPIEQPTKFELVINLRTAKALGLTIPQSVLLRADEVIQ